MSRLLPLASFFLGVALLIALSGWSSPLQPAAAAPGITLTDQYIVTFKPGVEPERAANAKAKAYGLTLRHVYKSSIRGFAGTVSPGQLKRLQNDPDVATIMPDRPVAAFSDQRPLGIRRIQADRNPVSLVGSHTNPISVDVAVIDTGIDPNHPDLNVVGGVSCVPGESSYADQNGHGTHVAGTIAALDNGIGVVGVAPGARLWAVRVLNANGEGEFSDVICGIDWVTAHAGTIEVANMSLGGEEPVDSCTDGSLHEAICHSIDAGVTYVVAAGNSTMDASGFVPAAYPEVITVSAIVDTDGAPGGHGTSTYFYGNDDELATFSNFGAPVDIAAPGYNVYSTYIGGGYTYLSGTSMASPHVAGAAALYRYLNPGASQADVAAFLLSLAWPQGTANGFTNDVDSSPEPLLNAGAIGGDPLPVPPPACSITPTSGPVSTSVTMSCTDFGLGEIVRLYLDSTSSPQKGAFVTTSDGAGSGKFAIPDGVGGQHQIIAKGISSGIEIAKPFQLLPGIKTSATSGKSGTSTIVTLNGFAGNDTLSLFWDGGTTPIASATTSATGGAFIFLAVPDGVAGNHLITVTGAKPIQGSTPPSVQANFTVLPGLSLVPTAGRTGTTVQVILKGYGAGEQISLTWQNSPSSSVPLVTVAASSTGSASLAMTVPESVKGPHMVTGMGNAGNTASAQFTVTPAFLLSAMSGTVGSNLTLTFSGYGANESVSLKWYQSSSSSPLATVVTSSTGSGSLTVPVPNSVYGSHRLEAVGPVSGSVTAYFTVLPSLTLSPTSGERGSTTTATLAGFGANEVVNVKWFANAYTSAAIATATTSATGGGQVSFTVPADADPGDHKVEGTGGSSFARGSSVFTVVSTGPTPTNDPACSVDPVSGTVGSRITVTCSNFAKNESVRIYLDDPATPYKASIWTGGNSGGSSSFTLPESVGGQHQIIAIGVTSGLRVDNPFAVASSLTLAPGSGKVGSAVSVSLKGFGPSESVALIWDGGVTIKTATTNAAGSVTTSISGPEAPKGDHTVTGVGATSGFQAGATFTIVPSLTLSPTSATAGKAITVTLRGYPANEAVTINWFNGAVSSPLTTTTVSALGSGSATFTVPESPGGSHQVQGLGASGSASTATLNVTIGLAMSPTTGSVGSSIALTMTGFAASETISVAWYETTTASTVIGTLTASVNGSASGQVTVPASASGSHKLQVSGAVSGGTAYTYYSVKAGATATPVSSPAGTSVTLALTGFKSGETVNIAWFTTASASIPVASAVVNSVGSGSATFTVPADATAGDHKIQASGVSSFQKATATFTVTGSGTTAVQSGPPTWDVPVSDDFSAGDGALPPGWTLDSTSTSQIAVSTNGGDVRFTSPGGTSGGASLIREGAVFSHPEVRAHMRLARSGNGAGIVLAWNGPDDYIAVMVNGDADRIEVVEVSGGGVLSAWQNDSGSVPAKAGHELWLRVESGGAAGNGWLNIYWSADGFTFSPAGAVENLANVSGSTGIAVMGGNLPIAEFEDFQAVPGQASAPLVEATAIESPTETPVPAATDTPTPSPEPQATETPAPVPTEPEVTPTDPAPTQIPVVPAGTPEA